MNKLMLVVYVLSIILGPVWSVLCLIGMAAMPAWKVQRLQPKTWAFLTMAIAWAIFIVYTFC